MNKRELGDKIYQIGYTMADIDYTMESSDGIEPTQFVDWDEKGEFAEFVDEQLTEQMELSDYKEDFEKALNIKFDKDGADLEKEIIDYLKTHNGTVEVVETYNSFKKVEEEKTLYDILKEGYGDSWLSDCDSDPTDYSEFE